MALVRIHRAILTRISRDDGLSKSLKGFIDACQNDRPPPRIYKPSGIAANGEEYYPYLVLDLHHHHLHRRGDPLLVTQHVEGCIYGIGLTTHAEYFHGDRLLWPKRHALVIDWTGLENLRQDVLAHSPEDNA
jgi:hypothetical protein